ncbi:MAG: phosphonopyruvate decarboxylase [Magnetospirillum sp. WYHS-4]
MIRADDFLGPAKAAGFTFFSGVPCSFLTPVINRVISDRELRYVAAASEGEAVAIAAGAWLAGRKSAVICQNSGLGNAVNPLTSLNHPFRIPSMLIVTWRGGPGVKDEPQHQLMGEITPALLDVIRVPHRPFPKSQADVAPALAAAQASMDETGLPFAFVMEDGDVAEENLDGEPMPPHSPGVTRDLAKGGERPSRYRTMERLLSFVPDDAGIITATGKCTRELFTIADRPQHLYQIGSMGCVAPMALGVAMNVTSPVIALDGDGAALMKMGAMATVGVYGSANLVHVVLDNGTYDSTGGQPTVSNSVDFAAVAGACGYAGAYSCDDLEGFEIAVRDSLAQGGPRLVHMRIAPGSMSKLGRPGVAPSEVARRFQDFLKPYRKAGG